MRNSNTITYFLVAIVMIGLAVGGWQYWSSVSTVPAENIVEQATVTAQPTEIVFSNGTTMDQAVESATSELDRGASNLPVPGADDLSDTNLGL